MKIVFLDKKSLGADCDISGLEKFGELVNYDSTLPDEVIDRIKDADAILTNKVNIDKAAIDAAPYLKYIGIVATGTNNVDLKYAAQKGITVTNVKGYSTTTVVQHTFALLFSVMEQLNFYDSFIKSGEYSHSAMFTYLDRPYMELAGKTWGIIGLGEIGRGVAMAAKAFGCNIIYYSTSGKNSTSDYRQVDFDTLLKESDIISVHAPLNENTKDLMNYDAFSKMKKSAYFVNVGRGPIVVEPDLAKALNEGTIAGAGLDVFCHEPIEANNPLIHLNDPSKLAITPHIAWASIEARQRLVEELALNIQAYLDKKSRNVVS